MPRLIDQFRNGLGYLRGGDDLFGHLDVLSAAASSHFQVLVGESGEDERTSDPQSGAGGFSSQTKLELDSPVSCLVQFAQKSLRVCQLPVDAVQPLVLAALHC